ncbi:MAG TPA: tyrosine-type recombinase/integrase, partial [Rhodothermales bacterium]|nr:tyrosine-type recombinase/integrase [Rhodothermales bacterium]
DGASPLFRSVDRSRNLTDRRLDRVNAWRVMKKRAKEAGVYEKISPHSLRATGITIYLGNGGSLEHAQTIAGHADPRTTKLYDRTSDQVSLDEIEKIVI